VLLAAHALWALAFREPASASSSSARALLAESLLLLEAALGVSAHNAQLRLAAVRVCGWIGCAEGVTRHFPFLRLKHSALDALGHVFMSQATRLHSVEALTHVCEAVNKWRL
jgi:hypothetical protein